jgi:hypothetical protein
MWRERQGIMIGRPLPTTRAVRRPIDECAVIAMSVDEIGRPDIQLPNIRHLARTNDQRSWETLRRCEVPGAVRRMQKILDRILAAGARKHQFLMF